MQKLSSLEVKKIAARSFATQNIKFPKRKKDEK